MDDFKQQIITLLERFDVEYWTYGKNVSRDSINVRCPYCSDTSNHLGIFINSMLFNCWKCERKGHFSRVLAYLTGLPVSTCEDLCKQDQSKEQRSALDRIKGIVNKIKTSEASSKHPVKEARLPEYTHLLSHSYDKSNGPMLPLLRFFLKRRHFTIDDCIYHYCSICVAGSFSHRLIIPILLDGKIVAYQGADLTGKSKLKYKNSLDEINQFLYGYDDIQSNNRIILVEGVFDVWRLRDNVLATFGTHLTKEQKLLLREKKPSEIILCWDGDAYFKSRKQVSELSAYVNAPIHCIPLPRNEDPDSYSRTKTLQTIKEKLDRLERSPN